MVVVVVLMVADSGRVNKSVQKVAAFGAEYCFLRTDYPATGLWRVEESGWD